MGLSGAMPGTRPLSGSDRDMPRTRNKNKGRKSRNEALPAQSVMGVFATPGVGMGSSPPMDGAIGGLPGMPIPPGLAMANNGMGGLRTVDGLPTSGPPNGGPGGIGMGAGPPPYATGIPYVMGGAPPGMQAMGPYALAPNFGPQMQSMMYQGNMYQTQGNIYAQPPGGLGGQYAPPPQPPQYAVPPPGQYGVPPPQPPGGGWPGAQPQSGTYGYQGSCAMQPPQPAMSMGAGPAMGGAPGTQYASHHGSAFGYEEQAPSPFDGPPLPMFGGGGSYPYRQ